MTVKEFVNKFCKNTDDLIDTELDTKYSVITYNYEKKVWEKEKIVGVLKKLSSKIQMVQITVDGKSIEVTPDHEFTVHKLDTDTVEKVQAKDIYANPDNFEIAVEE